MGLFDLLGPPFGWLDTHLAGILPGAVRLVLWGALAGAMSMFAFRFISPQRRLRDLRLRVNEARSRLEDFDGPLNEALPLMRRMLALSLRQVAIVAGPALLASMPALFVIVWVSTAFGHAFPAQIEGVRLDAHPSRFSVQWLRAEDAPTIAVHDTRANRVTQVALAAPVATIHKRHWWNALIGNPAGYLGDEVPIERVDIGLPRQAFIAAGPAWLRGWEFIFFSALLASSIALKLRLRIE